MSFRQSSEADGGQRIEDLDSERGWMVSKLSRKVFVPSFTIGSRSRLRFGVQVFSVPSNV